MAHLVFDGHDLWFHSVNDAWLVRAIFDHIEAMIRADRFLPLPPELIEYAFNYYTWDAAQPLPLHPDVTPAAGAGEAPADAAPLSGVAFLTHADTDLLNLRAARDTLPADFGPVTGVALGSVRGEEQMQSLLAGAVGEAQIVLVRVHGRFEAVPGAARLLAHARTRGQRLLLISGTNEPDPELAALSLAPLPVLDSARAYLAASGWPNLRELLLSVSDSLRLTAYGAQPRRRWRCTACTTRTSRKAWTPRRRWPSGNAGAARPPRRPAVGILLYRAHALSGNTGFIDALVTALDDAGADALPVFTTSLRDTDERGDPHALALLRGQDGPRVDAVISTLSFAMTEVQGGAVTPAGEAVGAFARLGVPVVQGLTTGGPRGPWATSARGLNPLDTAMNVALPEFDGRLISVPFAFKERVGDGAGEAAARLVADPERAERVAGVAVRLARLRHVPNSEKRVAFVFTNSTAKASQVGNAVGLDSAASLLGVLRALRDDGYDVGTLPATSDELMHALLDRATYDTTLLTPAQLERAVLVPRERYAAWFADLPDAQQRRMRQQWGDPPGQAYLSGDSLALAGLHFGKMFVALQPPRGYGMDPDAIYHTPDLPPTHHYHALYRWLREPPAAGGSARTRWCMWASTARWNGCPARASA
ncbi:cobaltochelatase subunit CobN [Deinococcus caeni]|uniref:cobaltochelatase subunit CobN n=1 Tax=Deinococcus caeni TaxID=569127 RepID=UPI0036140A05